MNIIALIPARGGSKGIPRKNIVEVNKKPLINYTIEVALKSKLIDRVIVSTDSEEIAEIAKAAGAEVPFIRPEELAQDNTPTYPVIKHAIEWLESNDDYKPDIIALLEPTFPIRNPEEVDDAIAQLRDDDGADSIRGVIEPFQTPYKSWKVEGNYLKPLMETDEKTCGKPRQSLPKVYWQNGFAFISKYRAIMEKGSIEGDNILPYVMPDVRFLDIDEKKDLELLRSKLEK